MYKALSKLEIARNIVKLLFDKQSLLTYREDVYIHCILNVSLSSFGWPSSPSRPCFDLFPLLCCSGAPLLFLLREFSGNCTDSAESDDPPELGRLGKLRRCKTNPTCPSQPYHHKQCGKENITLQKKKYIYMCPIGPSYTFLNFQPCFPVSK